MLRLVRPFYCYSVPPLSRVGVFPLHLDPPTAQHREIFRLLVGDTGTNVTINGNSNSNMNTSSSSSSPYGHDDNACCPGSLWCLKSFAESLKRSEYVPFDHLILVPNTRFPVALRFSTHIAALTTLVTRGLSRVHVDFTALEHPDEDMPCVYELTQKYKNSILVHWLQDAHEMHNWANFVDVKYRVPMLLLQTVSLPVVNLGKPHDPRFNEKNIHGGCSVPPIVYERGQHQYSTQYPKGSFSGFNTTITTAKGNKSDNGNCDTNFGGSPLWASQGCGEEEVEISRSYISSSLFSWMTSSDDVSALMQASESDKVITNERCNNDNNDTIPNLRYKSGNGRGVRNENGVNHDGDSGRNNDSGDINKNAVSQSHCSIDNNDRLSAVRDVRKGEEEEENDHHGLSHDAMPVRRKVCQLIEELFFTHQSMEGGEGRNTPHTPLPRVEVHAVLRCTGADVRQALWEREVDLSLLLTEPVYRYISSHGLYHDHRKDAYPKVSRVTHGSSGDVRGGFNNDGSSKRKGKVPSFGFSASLSFPGFIPRLELHYDKNNLLARDYYEKLSVFEVSENEDPDLIVPIGGDGYMMHCIRNNWRRFIPFFGVNAGHLGYLLNDPSSLEELLSAPLKLHTTIMLYCLAEKETEAGEKVLLSELAFNDAWVERSSGQTALIRILVNGEERIRQLRGDGVLVATAAGSTAYCQALGASPVPVSAPLIQVVGSNVVSPAQWRPTHLNQEDQVELEVIDSFRRPCRCFVDSVDVGNVTRMFVRSSRAAGVAIAFASSCDLQQKLYQMQFPKTM